MPKKRKSSIARRLKEQEADQALSPTFRAPSYEQVSDDVKGMGKPSPDEAAAKKFSSLVKSDYWTLIKAEITHVQDDLSEFVNAGLKGPLNLEELGLRTLVKDLIGYHLQRIINRVEGKEKLYHAHQVEQLKKKRNEQTPDKP